MTNNNIAKELYPKLSVFGYSFGANQDQKELNLYSALVTEHNFHSFITDPVTIAQYDLNNPKIICSFNYPHPLMLPEHIEYFLKDFNKKFPDIRGYIISLQKYDIVKTNWDKIRSMLKTITSAYKGELYVSVDGRWFNDNEDITRYFSILDSFETVIPVISCHGNSSDLDMETLAYWGFLANSSAISEVMYFGPPPTNPQTLLSLLDNGFDHIVIPSKLAVEFVTQI